MSCRWLGLFNVYFNMNMHFETVLDFIIIIRFRPYAHKALTSDVIIRVVLIYILSVTKIRLYTCTENLIDIIFLLLEY